MNLIPSNRGERDPIGTRTRIRRKVEEEKDEETVRAIVESIPTTPTPDEPDPVEDEVPDSDNDESINADSDASSKGDDSSEKDDIETDMRCVFALIDSGIDKGDVKFDPKAEEEKYYADCNEDLNDNTIIGCVVVEPTYRDDGYKHINHTNP